MYHFSDFKLTNVCGFYRFAKEFDGTFELSQFRRINDMTIGWQSTKYGTGVSGVPCPIILITLDFDDDDDKYFVMEVKLGSGTIYDTVYCDKFNSPMAALNYLNACVNIIQARKKRADSIWKEYGF